MPIVPRTVPQLLSWAAVHADEWESAAASIGLSPAQAAAFSAAAEAAQDAVRAAEDAQRIRLTATAAARSAVADLRKVSADTLATIKAFAANQPAPGATYCAALIPEPRAGTPVAPPGEPRQFTSQFNSLGHLTIRWKCDNPAAARGTVYEVARQTAINGPFEILAIVGTRTFTDRTLPAGSPSVTYTITAIRSTRRGSPGAYAVSFGVEKSRTLRRAA